MLRFPLHTVSRFWLRFSSMRKIPSIHWGSRLVTLRRSDSTLRPHRAKHCRSNRVMLHSRKPTAILTVLPLRTAPSHRMPSSSAASGSRHQVIARRCFGLNG